MSKMDHGRFEELKDAYVLGALAEQERREFEEYLAAHPERQVEVDELGAIAGLLALALPEQEPPPELRRRIMGVVEAETSPEAGRSRAERTSWLARVWELLSTRNLALGAAAVVAVGLFSWGALLRAEIQDLRGQVQSLQSQAQGGPQMIELEGAGTKQGARAKLVTLEGDRAVLVVEDMPPLPEGKTYQIWVIDDDGDPKPSGLFDPRGDAIAAVVGQPVETADTVAVTVEPEGGSLEPTTEPMLVVEVRA